MILNQIITMYIGLLVMKSYINANNMTNIDNAKTQNFKNVIVSISCLCIWKNDTHYYTIASDVYKVSQCYYL